MFDFKSGSVDDSIEFILGNFIEMNKLWVRLQHQTPTRERLQRERERGELKVLVGSNLVRLSQLDGLTLALFKDVNHHHHVACHILDCFA